MAKRSLKATPEGQLQAKRAFERTGWTQEQLALEVGLNTRQSVWKFFTGRPIGYDS
jgi:predicted NACHT family NTPase